jgi:NADH dehydrogenase FAD-containing subunit
MVDKYVDLQSTSASPKPKKHICVIGAGASGLVVMKELTELIFLVNVMYF